MERTEQYEETRWVDTTVIVGRMSVGQQLFGVRNIESGLSRDGRVYLQKIGAAINGIAPNPGALVYVHAKRLALRIDGLEPVLFSAVDACTHLQVAQLYLTPTVQAAVSFVEFVSESFPFSVTRIKTPAQRPFHGAGSSPRRDFTSMVSQRGYFHSVTFNSSEDALFLLTSRVLLDGLGDVSQAECSGYDLQRELNDFLYFHNSVRAVPWLGGVTPMEKLKSFSRYESFSASSLFVHAAAVVPQNNSSTE